MNQIINTPHNLSAKYIYIAILSFLIFSIFILLIYILVQNYEKQEKSYISNKMLKTYSISKLYTDKTPKAINTLLLDEPYIIGKLYISKLDLSLPVMSECNDELLEISVCRFYGPKKIVPSGNLCIAGHNYDNGTFFSDLARLCIGDEICFTDYSNKIKKFIVYNIYEINSKDTTCTSQNTFGSFEITLVTCNNFNGNRIIIKAK